MISGIEILRQFNIDRCMVKVANVEPLGAPGALDDALLLLSHYRREKTLKYRFNKGKWLSAGAGLLLDNMLQEHGLRERDMQYTQGEHGKPAFANHPQLHFNLSHSDTLVACALGEKPMGVDVQTIVKARPSLVNYTMGEKEIAQFNSLANPEAQNLFFTQLWTLKESYVKATGQGLSHEFPEFSINDDGNVFALSSLIPAATFKLFSLPTAVLAIAILE